MAPLLSAIAAAILFATARGLGADDAPEEPGPVMSGDVIFLWSHHGMSVDVDVGAARARWQLRGTWQGLVIERAAGPGVVNAGDLVHLRGHTGDCLEWQEDTESVGVWRGGCPEWEISHADGSAGVVLAGDAVHLKLTSASRYLDVEGNSDGLLRARWDLTGEWQTFRIEVEVRDAIQANGHITLAARLGNQRLDVSAKGEVRARWTSIGAWRALVLEADENLGPWSQSFAIAGGDGRAMHSGDKVTLWGANGKLVEAERDLVAARFSKQGLWQTFTIEKSGGGTIRRGDIVFLKAHTGSYVEVHDETVTAIGTAWALSSAFVIDLDTIDLDTGSSDRGVYRQGAFLFVLALALVVVVVYEALQPVAPPPKGGAPRLEALDAPRWIASAQIVACHFYKFSWGAAWTQFFFVLSGFVLSYVEMARPADKAPKVSQLRYVTHRLITLYPTYIFTIALGAMQWSHSALDHLTLPLHLLFMQAWFPIVYRRAGSDEWQWSGVQWAQVSWFVSVLVIYWLMLRPITRRVRKMSLNRCFAMLFALWAVSVFWWFIGDVVLKEQLGCTWVDKRCYSLYYDYIIYHGWIGMFHVFLAGIVMARVFVLTSMKDAEVGGPVFAETQKLALDPKRAPGIFRFGSVIGYAGYIILVVALRSEGYKKCETFFHNGGLLPLMLLVLVGGALGQDPMAKYLFQNRVFRILGRISYPQYLIQCNVWGMIMDIFPEEGALVPRQAVFPFALLVLSYVLERLVTRVGVEWLKPSKDKRPPSIVARAVALAESASLGRLGRRGARDPTARAASPRPPAPAPRPAGKALSMSLDMSAFFHGADLELPPEGRQHEAEAPPATLLTSSRSRRSSRWAAAAAAKAGAPEAPEAPPEPPLSSESSEETSSSSESPSTGTSRSEVDAAAGPFAAEEGGFPAIERSPPAAARRDGSPMSSGGSASPTVPHPAAHMAVAAPAAVAWAALHARQEATSRSDASQTSRI